LDKNLFLLNLFPIKNQHQHKQLFLLALPMIFSNITVPLLGLVDTAVIGHLGEAYYLGGATVGAMVITFITWLCGFLRMSTTGLAAQAYGAEILHNNGKSQGLLILLRGIIVACFIGFSLILLQTWYLQGALYLAGGSEQVQFYALQYSEIRIWGLPAALTNLVILGWLLGNHQAKLVMWLLIFTNMVNLILDLVFVIGFGWQVQGIAFATLIAEYSGLLLGLFAIGIKFKHYFYQLVNEKGQILNDLLERSALLAYFKLNRDILIRTLCLELCFVFITFQGARLGDNVVAANAILMNFLLLISFGLDGIANATEAMVGKAKGAKDTNTLAATVRIALFWTGVFAFLYSTIFALFGQQLIGLITNIPSVITFTNQYLFWLILLPIISCWCYLFDGVYIGLMQAKTMRNSMVIATFAGFFPIWFILQDYGNHGLWAAFSIFMLARGITLAWHYQTKVVAGFTS
jgi:MATE family multidrug resistance protein